MINVGIIGCGRFTNAYLKTLKRFEPEVCVKYLCSRTNKSLENINKNLPMNFHWTNDYKRVCLDPFIDLIIIVTPPESHYEIAKFALENNKNVLCEKPFVFSVKEAEELERISVEKNKHLIINYIHLWNKFYEKAFLNKFGAKKVIMSVSNPKTGREHSSILWDWGTHEISMLLHMFPEEVFEKPDTIASEDKLAFKVKSQNIECECYFDINSNIKSRSIKIEKIDGSVFEYFDTFDQNPLENMLVDVVKFVKEAKERVSNAKLAKKVTEILLIINKQLNE